MNAMAKDCLEIKEITKSYHKRRVLNSVTDSFDTGFHALLGPNGAGKSTLMGIMCGCIRPDSGELFLGEQKITDMPQSYRDEIRILFQDPPLFENYSAEDVMKYGGILFGLKRSRVLDDTEQNLKKVGLFDERRMKVRQMSGGMKKRLAIAQTLMGDFRILFLDEATAGLDISERDRFRVLMEELKTDHIILMSTHILSDVEMISDEIHILGAGELKDHISLRSVPKEERSSQMIREQYLRMIGEQSDSVVV